MKKHTNGPWLITTIDGDDCLMVGGGDGSDVVADIRTDRPEDEVEANARLIAAAPDLLAALMELGNIVLDNRDAVDDAIEKALGEVAFVDYVDSV